MPEVLQVYQKSGGEDSSDSALQQGTFLGLLNQYHMDKLFGEHMQALNQLKMDKV